MDDYPLKVIVAGVEHSGTTVLSDVIKRHPHLNAGFECGLLMADDPADFANRPPWYEWLQRPLDDNHWGIAAEDIHNVTAAASFEDAYRAIIEYSPLFPDKKTDRLIDKTPIYVFYLLELLPKVADFVPCVVIEKTIENLWRSHKKRGVGIRRFCDGYKHYRDMLLRAIHGYGKQIHIVRYEEYCTDPVKVTRQMFDYIGADYEGFVGVDEERYVREGFKKSIASVDITDEEMVEIIDTKEECAPVDWE